MKQSSIMQADRNDQADVRQTVSGEPASVVVSTAAATRTDAAVAPIAAATLSTLTDAQLYRQCKYYGQQAKGWMRKFESLLPEVYRRRLHKRRGFAGIHEFAQKLAGMSREKVDRILQLSKKLEDKPALKALFESGDAGYTKIERVLYIASAQTDVIWAEKVQKCSQFELKLLVERERDKARLATAVDRSYEPGKMTNCDMDSNESADECASTGVLTKVSFNMRPETERKLRALQRELEKARGEAISLGETIEILVNREHEKLIVGVQRKKTANYCPDCVKKRADEAAAKSEITRAVPAEIRYTVLARQNYQCAGGISDAGHAVGERRDGTHGARGKPDGICANDGSMDGGSDAVCAACTHPPTELHHLDGWALTKKHDPDRMRYLCKNHHAELHADDRRVQAYRSG